MDGEYRMFRYWAAHLSFTIKHPLKKKYMEQPRKSGSLNMPALQHSVKTVMRPATDRYYLPPIVFLAIQLVKYHEVYIRHDLLKSTRVHQKVQRRAGI
jgi:hypothetical protein